MKKISFRKTAFALLCLVMLVSVLFTMPLGGGFTAYASSSDEVVYQDGTLRKVPADYVGAFTVAEGTTAISENAFKGCKYITSVAIPDSVETIGRYAFSGCSSLVSVNIPDGIETVDTCTFEGCRSLVSITLPDSLKIIAPSAFESCASLTGITLPDSLESIGNGAFKSCKALASITIPDKVTVIEKYTFEDCAALESVTLPDGITALGNRAFYECLALKEITLPDGITSIGTQAFKYCKALQTVNLPNGIEKISDETFYHCFKLASIELPESIKSIGKGAFTRCEKLTSLTIPDSVESIGITAFSQSGIKEIKLSSSLKDIPQSAFSACTKLVSVTIPEGVETIASYAFSGCSALESIVLPNSIKSIDKYAISSCANLKTVTMGGNLSHCLQWLPKKADHIIISDGCTSIADAAFFDCTSIMTVTIPRSVTAIGTHSFYNCSSLTDVYYKGSEAQWSMISGISEADGNRPLTVADIHYNYGRPTTTVTTTTSTCTSSPTTAPTTQPTGNTDRVITRLAGDGRCETAIEISKASRTKTKAVILASGDNYADALVGVPLAYLRNAPILLIRNHKLDTATLKEIRRLGAKEIYILGGEYAINKGVADKLEEKGFDVYRIAGQDRFATSLNIARNIRYNFRKPTEAFFVYSHNYPDALAIGAVAANKNAPIFYIAADGSVNKDIANYIKENGIKKATIISGPAIVSENAEKNLKKCGMTDITRIYGANRYETCLKINKAYANILTGDALCVATGTNYPDALAGGVFAAENKAPLMLVDSSLSSDHISLIRRKNTDNIYIFGGEGVVSEELAQEIARY